MTQGEKELLFKDLCARLPYEVVIHTDYKDIKLDRKHKHIGILYYEDYSEEAKKRCNYDVNDFSIIICGCYYGENIKPYLRPMSSMTEEELNELRNYTGLLYDNLDLASFQNGSYKCLDFYLSEIPADVVIKVFDWLHMHHFDYRGLISMGLALVAPKDMYNNK